MQFTLQCVSYKGAVIDEDSLDEECMFLNPLSGIYPVFNRFRIQSSKGSRLKSYDE